MLKFVKYLQLRNTSPHTEKGCLMSFTERSTGKEKIDGTIYSCLRQSAISCSPEGNSSGDMVSVLASK